MTRSGSTIVKFIVYLVVLGALGFIGLSVTFAWLPRNVVVASSDGVAVTGKSVDLMKRMQAAIDEEYTVTITESEVNDYLAEKVQIAQSSLVGEFVTIESVQAELQEGMIDITIERSFDLPGNEREDGSKRVPVLPFIHTCSMQLKIYSEEPGSDAEGTSVVEFPGGYLGQTQLPGLLVTIVKPSFDVLADALAQEIELGFHNMTKVTVSDGVIELDPRLPDQEL